MTGWREHLTPWEDVQLEALGVARAGIGDRADALSQTFTAPMNRIRNRGAQRARIAAGTHNSCRRKAKTKKTKRKADHDALD